MKSSKKILATTVTAALAATLVSATAASAEPTVEEYPSIIASMGDSMTQAATTEATKVTNADGSPGFTGSLGDAPQNSWSTGTGNKVESHYNRIQGATGQQIYAYNVSKSGSKSSDLTRQAELVAAQNVGYVTILSGANDICSASSLTTATTAAAYKSNVRAALATLSKTGDTDVLLASVPSLISVYNAGKNSTQAQQIWAAYSVCSPMLGNPTDVSESANNRRAAVEARVQEYNLALREVCSEFSNCTYDDEAVYETEITLDDLSVDYFHANIAGQNKLAENTWDVAQNEIFTKVVPDPTPTPEPTTPPVVTPTPTTPPVVVTPAPTTPPVVVTPAPTTPPVVTPTPTTPPVVVTPAPTPTPKPPVVAPTIKVISPSVDVVSDKVDLKVSASSDTKIKKVIVTINNSKKETLHQKDGYWVGTLDSRKYANGAKLNLVFTATDAQGDTSTAKDTVTVDNGKKGQKPFYFNGKFLGIF